MVIFSETSSTGAPRLLLDLRACPRVCPDTPYITYDRLNLVEKTSLITLVYFAVQLLAQPTDGLPPVPAALLTLTGVSATTYVANKIVNTKAAAA